MSKHDVLQYPTTDLHVGVQVNTDHLVDKISALRVTMLNTAMFYPADIYKAIDQIEEAVNSLQVEGLYF